MDVLNFKDFKKAVENGDGLKLKVYNGEYYFATIWFYKDDELLFEIIYYDYEYEFEGPFRNMDELYEYYLSTLEDFENRNFSIISKVD